MNAPLPRITSYSRPTRTGVYPVTSDEMGIHLRIDSDVLAAEAAYLDELIKAATHIAEKWTKRTFVVSTITSYLDDFCSGAEYTVRLSPVSAVTIEYLIDDVLTELDSSEYYKTESADFPKLVPVDDWPSNADDRRQAVKLTFTAGFPDDETEKTITGLTSTGTVATAISANHGFSTGDRPVISGATPTEYNGSQQITVIDADTFTYTVVSGLTTPATGTITATIYLSTVPDDIKEAIKQHVAAMYTNRGDCTPASQGGNVDRSGLGSSVAVPPISRNIYDQNRILELRLGI